MDEQELASVFQTQQDIAIELRRDSDIIHRFIDGDLIKRTVDAKADVHGGSHYTCTAFSLYYISGKYLLTPKWITLLPSVITPEKIISILRRLSLGIHEGHANIGKSTTKQSKATAIGPLPNPYNSCIQLAGCLRTTRIMEVNLEHDVIKTYTRIIMWLANIVNRFGGWVPRIEAEQAPSAYLTYWAGAALQEWLSFEQLLERGDSDDRYNKKNVQKALKAIAEWSSIEVANAIAHHHAGLTSQFDIIETGYSVLGAIQFGSGPEIYKMSKHAISILFSERYFSDGCFAPSAPVLADQHNFSLQCPTVELLSLLLLADRSLLYEQWKPLCTVFDWLVRYRQPNGGWFPENVGRFSKPTIFMTISAITFLAGLYNLLDDTLHQGACEILGVAPYVHIHNLDDYEYPTDISEIFRDHVVKPLKEPLKTEIASYSMILYGPPGTAKTTIAKKLAQDLEWPILIVNQDAFLRKGVSNIYAEADRLFRLISYLKAVVVLFDEVEELVEDRSSPDKSSRILTTAMLPHIHFLRDRHRIVFIFATNNQERIDEAASRLGRFDIIRGIMPPTPDERKKILNSLIKKLDAMDFGKIFDSTNVYERTEDFGYMDLYALVRYIKISADVSGKVVNKKLIDEAINIYSRRTQNSEFKKSMENFKHARESLDRP